MAARTVLFTLEWARISLYELLANSATRENPWGTPDLNRPILLGASADNLRLIYRYNEIARFPTGSAYPRIQHTNEEHYIEIGRVWITRPDENNESAEDDYTLARNRPLILYIAWSEPAPKVLEEARWKARTYYGVKAREFNLASVDALQFTGEQALRAEWFKEERGVGAIPEPTGP